MVHTTNPAGAAALPMRARQRAAPLVARIAWAGPLITVIAIIGLELLARRGARIAMPGAVLMAAVVGAAYLGGLRAGLLSAGLAVAYAGWPTVAGGLFAVTPGAALPRLAGLLVLLPSVAVAVGLLKERTQRQLRELERVVAQLREANQRLERLSRVDGLMGIGNRRRFDEALAAAWALCTHRRRPLAVLVIDVDCFKAYNDRYGHPAGDAALQQVARTLSRTLYRPTDLLARYGGEEFAVLLPDTDAAGACVAAERLRQAILGLRLEHRASRAHQWLTVSIGVAAADPSAAGTPTALVVAADDALYEAKRAGRNRVQAATPAPAAA